MSLAFFSVSNINQFQELMYRPLYLVRERPPRRTSIRRFPSPENPVYSDGQHHRHHDLKPYKWSNGENGHRRGRHVLFWMKTCIPLGEVQLGPPTRPARCPTT